MPSTFVIRFFKGLGLILALVLMTVAFFATAFAQGGDISRGKQLYQQNCAVCHGDNAQGRIGARLAKDFPGIRVDALLKETISNGVQGSVMPAWSTSRGGPLSDAQINDLVAYVQSLGHQAPPVSPVPVTPTATRPLPSPVATFPPGDAGRGAALFAQNCAVCHGDRGQGRIGATLAKDWSGINTTALIEATIARGVPGSKMPSWGVAYGGPLSPQDIADAAAFIRTLKQPGIAETPTPPASQGVGGIIGSPLALVCGGLVIIALIVILAIGLAGSRSRT